MVKVGILDADIPLAGELLRILINHPETDIKTLYSPLFTGRNISSIHHGFIGEIPLIFSDKINLEDLDFLIVPQYNEVNKNIIEKIQDFENLKTVIYGNNLLSNDSLGFEIGLSEINRKALVRGAKKAFIPSPVITPSLITLNPLASFLLLNSDIDIVVSLPADMVDLFNETIEAKYIEDILRQNQSSFKNNVNLKIIADHQSDRGVKTTISLKINLPLVEIEKIYDQIYDDHNFTFITRSEVKMNEVEGTQKVVIRFDKPDTESLLLETFSDARLRGGAGDIVHVMNLFFGLHEKTGLWLKAARF